MNIDPVTGQVISLLRKSGLTPYTLLLAGESAASIAIPFLLGKLVDTLIDGAFPIAAFCAVCGIAAIALALGVMQKSWIHRIARDREHGLRNRLLLKFQAMTPGSVDGGGNGEIAMKFLRDVNNMGALYREFYPRIIGAALILIFAVVSAFVQNAVIACVYVALLPILFFSLHPYGKIFKRISRTIRLIYDRALNRIFEFMHIFPYLKSMAAEGPFIQGTRAKFTGIKRLNRIQDNVNLAFEFKNRLALFVGEYLILGIAGYFAYRRIIHIGDVVFFQTLLLSLLNAFVGILQVLPMWSNIRESVYSLNEILESTTVENADAGIPFHSGTGGISFRHVSFGYPGSGRMALRDFSCHIQRGDVVAVIGENGAGKTTLLKLLIGYFAPDSGKITISGRPLCEWKKASYRKMIASVFQDSLLLTGTIRDNITLKNGEYSPAELSAALELSGADTLVNRMRDGLDHYIGFEGGGLSGGERQKVAIARALIRKPEILIFDEVTNHLDYASRCKMKTLLQSVRGKTTVIIVTHDPEIIGLCNRTIEMSHAVNDTGDESL